MLGLAGEAESSGREPEGRSIRSVLIIVSCSSCAYL